ncbi:MAG TPA: type II toxin-antitoxin system VapC family toxin [Terriglobales bacterium]|nr:type II toxin-antitoxin system VapC family toxin [Terriglobales bacterium]
MLDSSATLAWIYSEETTSAIVEVFQHVTEAGAWVPSLWRLEVGNILEMGIRRGRHDARFRDATFADLSLMSIRLDPETDRQAWTATAKIVSRYRLTYYDAAYLELAQRRGLPLATLDSDLRKAAKAEDIALLGV